MKRYRGAAAGQQIDPLGYGFVPFGYAAGQVLAEAVEATKSLDQDQIADYMHTHHFDTVVGDIGFDKAGDWSEPRTVFTQFQKVEANDIEQFADGKVQPILWPPKYKTGDLIYPYTAAKP